MVDIYISSSLCVTVEYLGVTTENMKQVIQGQLSVIKSLTTNNYNLLFTINDIPE